MTQSQYFYLEFVVQGVEILTNVWNFDLEVVFSTRGPKQKSHHKEGDRRYAQTERLYDLLTPPGIQSETNDDDHWQHSEPERVKNPQLQIQSALMGIILYSPCEKDGNEKPNSCYCI